MSLDLIRKDNIWVLEYKPELVDMNFVYEKLSNNQTITVAGVFYFSKNNLLSDLESIKDTDSVEFILANLDNDYFKISKMILETNNDVLFYHNVEIKPKYFKISKNTSVMRLIENISEQVIIGGELEDSISISLLETLIRKFPNDVEIKKYIKARVYGVLKDYLNIPDKPEVDYLKYLRKKNEIVRTNLKLQNEISLIELEKYKFLYNELSQMLTHEDEYSEKTWQSKIMNIILLIYPKYLLSFQDVQIDDTIKSTNRYLDYIFVDFVGNIDIVEIKKPFDNCLVSKNVYRGNHIPLRELSGAIMQIEKYIYHLLRFGKTGEDRLNDVINKKHSNKLQNANIKLKIINPKGLIIMGREINLSEEQKNDFEFIKRKYKNIMDILTYDDLLLRISSLINKFTNHQHN
jgi:hypothetical protein